MIILAAIFCGCPEVVEDPDPPAEPRLVEKTAPEAWVESGIDADNNGQNRIVLMWYPNQEIDLQAYDIFRADTMLENGFMKIATIDIYNNFGADTVYFDENVFTYVDYYYYIRARDNADNYSPRSDTLKYRLLREPVGLAPNDTTVTRNFIFKWMDRADPKKYEWSHHFVIRLDNLDTDSTIWICRLINHWYDDANIKPIQLEYFEPIGTFPDGVITCNQKYSLPSGLYRWKIKTINAMEFETGLDESSSESEWLFFEIE